MSKLPKITEAEFMDQVAQYARLRGWMVFHARPARTKDGYRTPVQYDGQGFPDLVLARKGAVILAELKRDKHQKLTLSQIAWLRAIDPHGGYIWTPDDWPLIEEVLK